MVINSDPYELAPTAQLSVTVKQIPCLDHTSHVDTSKLVTLSAMETVSVVETAPSSHKGPLSSEVKKAIKAIVVKHGIMPNDQMKLLLANL
jgi:hypothetical protein